MKPESAAAPRPLRDPRTRTLAAPRWSVVLARRARLRREAARTVAEAGLDRFDLKRIAAVAGAEWTRARNHYPTNRALLADMVRCHHQEISDRMVEAVLAARNLPEPDRLESLVVALLDALAAAPDAHRASVAAIHAIPAIAHNARHAQRWLAAQLIEALQAAAPEARGRPLLAEVIAWSLLGLVELWALRLDDAEGLSRGACGRLLASMATEAARAAASPYSNHLP
jgi:AcrR family transcriptional regulator